MDLHRHLAQLEMSCNLFVPAAADDERKDFSFARGQRIEALPQFGNNTGLKPPGAIALDPRLDRIEQMLLMQGLGQELDGAGFHRPHRHGDVAVTADEYDGKMDVRFHQRTLELQSARTRQSDVEYDATGCVGAFALKEFLRRPKRPRLQADRAKKIFERVTHGCVVVDYEHDGWLPTHWTRPDVAGDTTSQHAALAVPADAKADWPALR